MLSISNVQESLIRFALNKVVSEISLQTLSLITFRKKFECFLRDTSAIVNVVHIAHSQNVAVLTISL
jgi:hypothetical protein